MDKISSKRSSSSMNTKQFKAFLRLIKSNLKIIKVLDDPQEVRESLQQLIEIIEPVIED